MDALLALAFLLTLLGAMFVAHGVARWLRARRLKRELAGWVPAEAVVVGRRDGPRRRQAEPAVQFHEVRFRGPAGAEHTGVTLEGSLVVFPPGSPISVRYDPADPERVAMGDGQRAGVPDTILAAAMLVVGAVLLLAGAVTLLVRSAL